MKILKVPRYKKPLFRALPTYSSHAVRKGNIEFKLHPENFSKLVFWVLYSIEIMLVVLDGFINYGRLSDFSPIRRIFNMAKEGGLSTFFSSFQLLSVSLILLCLWIRTKGSNFRQHFWLVLSGFFLYLAIDDSAVVHERFGSTVQSLAIQADPNAFMSWISFFPSYTWQVVFVPIFGSIAALMIYFFRKELKTELLWIGYLALGCYAAAVSIDFLEGIRGFYFWLSEIFHADERALSHFSRVLEEFLEMFGTTLFLTTFLRHLMSKTNKISVIFEDK